MAEQRDETTMRRAADEAARMGKAAAEAGERVSRATTDLAQQNSQAVNTFWQTGLSTANRISERSAGEISKAVGFTGEEAQQAFQQSARNMAAMMQCASAISRGFEGLSRELFELARSGAERSLDRANKLTPYHTMQDWLAVQSEMIRATMEDCLNGGRRIAELSLRCTEQAARTVAETAERTAREARGFQERAH